MRNKQKRKDRLKEINDFLDQKVGTVIVTPQFSGEDGKIASLLVEVFDTYSESDWISPVVGLRVLQDEKLHKVYFKYSEIEFL